MGNRDIPDPHAKKLRDMPDGERLGPTLAGFCVDSDRPEYKRLYLTADGGCYVEFQVKDADTWTDIPPDQYPFLGEQATLVRLLPNVRVEYTYKRAFTTGEFDLDLRLEYLSDALSKHCDPDNTHQCTYRHTCR
jgi:hypothetical protein